MRSNHYAEVASSARPVVSPVRATGDARGRGGMPGRTATKKRPGGPTPVLEDACPCWMAGVRVGPTLTPHAFDDRKITSRPGV